MEALKQIIEQSSAASEHFPPEVQNSVDEVINCFSRKLRVAEKIDDE